MLKHQVTLLPDENYFLGITGVESEHFLSLNIIIFSE